MNAAALERLSQGGCVVLCSNVINVVWEAEIRAEVISLAAQGERAYFTVYEGDGSGQGRRSKTGWQENRRTRDYLNEITAAFGVVRILEGFVIYADRPLNKRSKP